MKLIDMKPTEELQTKLELAADMLSDAGAVTVANLIKEALKQSEIVEDQKNAVEWCTDAVKVLYELEDFAIRVAPEKAEAWVLFMEKVQELLHREW